MASRRENREKIRRLFRRYVNDFGPVAGEKIMRVIVDEIGRFRIKIPTGNHKGNPIGVTPNTMANIEILEQLYCRMCVIFGDASGRAIMQKLITELGGQRVTFPNHEDLWREERDRKIRAKYNGTNAQELGILLGLSAKRVIEIATSE